MLGGRLMDPSESSTYLQFSETLKAEKISATPAEIHGLLTGLLSSSARFTPQQALQEMLGQASAQWTPEFARLLSDTLKKVQIDLSSDELGFELLLPDDEMPVRERASHLADWCQGFLFGIGLGGEKKHSKQAQEILRDIQSIAQLEAENGGKAEEQAYFELVEFLRVAAQLLYTENELEKRQGKTSGN